MSVLLLENTKLYFDVARANNLLQRERLSLERAVQAQIRERDARLVTGEAVAATIAHEIKQPLTAMVTRSYVGLRTLDRAKPDLDKAKEEFKRIAIDGQRAGAIIQSIRANFRDNSRTEGSVDINELIGESTGLMRDDLNRHEICVDAKPNPQPLQARGDRIQLQQVLLNLITNAIEAMATTNHGARLLFIKAESRDDGYIEIAVGDNGVGIAAEDFDQVFKPLFTTKSDNMGMGLSICRSIVESHGGRLWVTANTVEGAVFRFTLRAHNQS
jgi:signal transduction histidine kinase